MAEKVIIIGGTAAGLSAASKAKRVDPSLDITVFEKSGYISYGACGLPYFVGDMIKEPNDLVSLSVDQMTRKRGVPTFIHHEVTRIDRGAQTVTVRNLDNGEVFERPYDKLVIATGARPIVPRIPGADAKGVYTLRTVEDGIRLKSVVQSGARKKAAIIGGGFIGIEVAEELTNSGVEVHLFEMMPRLLPFLTESFSEAVLDTLTQHGVHVHLNAGAQALMTAEGSVCGVRATDGSETPVDYALLSIGVVPASDLAHDAGLELGLKGAIVVDDEMRTSDPRIWACGDCVQMKNRITGGAAYVPLGTTANKQGRIAGGNLAGEHETFKGVLGSMVTKAFDLYISTGLSLDQAKAAGSDAVSSIITKGDRASYDPGSRDNTICLILDKKTGRLLGAQAIGSESVAGRINVFATAITCGMTVSEINELDLVYAPPVAPVYDPILIAASQAMKKVEG